MSHYTEARKWMTTLLDHPEQRLSQALVIVGPEASGKSTFAKMLGNCLPDDQRSAVRDPAYPVTDFMNGNRLVILDEPARNWQVWLKPIMISDHVTITHKSEPGRVIFNRSGFIVLTQQSGSEDNFRRWITLTPLEAFAILADI